MTVGPEMLMAYLDGELDAEGRAEVEHALATDPNLRDQLDQQRALRTRLKAYYGPVASEEVPEQLKAMLGAPTAEADQRSGVASLSEARDRRRSLPIWQSLAAVAATFVLGLLAGPLLFSEINGPMRMEDGTLIAEGRLARALETQLASAQSPDADIRIGITFADRDGRACRTFEAEGLAGLACRAQEQWALVTTTAAPARSAGPYRQAASPIVMMAAQDLMAGPALDADTERAARDAGWKMD